MPLMPRWLIPFLCVLLGGCPLWADRAAVTSVKEARGLSFVEVSSGRTVRLEGVVTYLRDASPSQFNFNLNDSSGGVMIYPQNWVSLSLGQRVRVEGNTTNAIHGLRIIATKVEPLTMGEFPAPDSSSISELHLRQNVGRYVQVDATLRSARLESPEITPQRLALDLGPMRERVTAWIMCFDASSAKLTPGSQIRLRGVPLHWTNARGQTQSVSLMMNSMDDVELLSSPDPIAPISLAEALLWNGSSHAAHRIKTSGIITLHRPGELIVIQDGIHAMRIRPIAQEVLGVSVSIPQIGERVDACGFHAMGEYTTELEDCEVSGTGAQTPVAPTEYSDAAALLADPLLVDLDARLVRLKGTVRAVHKQENNCMLEIDSGGVFMAASFPWDDGFQGVIRSGSVVSLTGVCNLHLSEQRRRLGQKPNQLSLTLHDRRNVSIVKAASWWDRSRLLIALGIATALATVAGLWAAHAGRRNLRLKKEIAAREAAESRLSMERTRMAGDLHDTLEQTLLAADLQLSAAARSLEFQPNAVSSRLALVAQLLSRGRREVRDAVWDLHAGSGKSQPLGLLLKTACQDAGAASTAKVEFEGPQNGEPMVPESLTAQLVRVVRESLTNALKHGAPKRVLVCLQYEPSEIKLCISDDGSGFLPEQAPGPESGHFGLSGMHERIRRLGGQLSIRSKPDSGVSIFISVPLEIS